MILIDLFLVNDTFHIIIFQVKITVLYIFYRFRRVFYQPSLIITRVIQDFSALKFFSAFLDVLYEIPLSIGLFGDFYGNFTFFCAFCSISGWNTDKILLFALFSRQSRFFLFLLRIFKLFPIITRIFGNFNAFQPLFSLSGCFPLFIEYFALFEPSCR